jgi:hypothetical protein
MTAVVNLNDITAAVGPTIFFYLPIGSLLNGYSSPLLVNKIFRGAILEYLREAECLSFSQCPHLRKINDDQLICPAQRILGGSIYLKTKQLDLSRCRQLKGEGVIFCLRSMPNIESVCLSSATRFHVTDISNDSSLLAAVEHLKYVDISGCKKLGTPEISCLASTLSGSIIRVLDFSGCSTLIGDGAAVSVAEHCHNLECVSVSWSKKLTTFGVAIIAFVCRSTLRCLSLRGCQSVRLTTLLYAHARACPVTELFRWWDSGEDVSVIRSQLTGSSSDNSFLTASYVKALIDALLPLVNVNGPIFAQLQDESERLMDLCKEYEERWKNHYGWVDRNDEHSLFGRLEKLDISDSYPIHGCDAEVRVLAVISWLNKGRLREIDMSGLSVSPHVVSALALANGPRLRCIEVSSLRITNLSSLTSLICMRGVSELDLSCSNDLINNRTTFVEMENLRSLKLDHLLIEDYNMEAFLSTTKRLLRLSVHGCSKLKVSVLTKAKAQNPYLKLLELDVRDVSVDVSLSKIVDTFTSLLKLNNRCTKVGKQRIQQHQQNYHWRVGARENRGSNKRKRGESRNVRDSPVVGSASGPLNCCSLQLTGFSKGGCTEQEMFGCKTCHIDFGRFVCLSCSKVCHQALGHEVFSIGYGPGYCDCSILSNCMCIEQPIT